MRQEEAEAQQSSWSKIRRPVRGEGAFGPGLPTTMSFQLCHLPEREAKLWEGHVCRAERAWYAVRARLEEARGWEMPRNLLGWAWLVEALGCDPTQNTVSGTVIDTLLFLSWTSLFLNL